MIGAIDFHSYYQEILYPPGKDQKHAAPPNWDWILITFGCQVVDVVVVKAPNWAHSIIIIICNSVFSPYSVEFSFCSWDWYIKLCGKVGCCSSQSGVTEESLLISGNNNACYACLHYRLENSTRLAVWTAFIWQVGHLLTGKNSIAIVSVSRFSLNAIIY